jgi:hypothetical protein
MSGLAHRIYIGILVGIGFLLLVILVYWGASYYNTPLSDRPFHVDHLLLKPSGPIGHGLGILGTLLILIGVFSYIARKKQKFLPRFGALKYWLEFHIFLCSVGPLLILFHTAFKFGGIVSISFWSMVAVVLSGVVGRFIYIQIPRTIQGRELSLVEIKELKDHMSQDIRMKYGLDDATFSRLMEVTQRPTEKSSGNFITRLIHQIEHKHRSRKETISIMTDTGLSGKDKRGVMKLLKNELKMNARIKRLQTMQALFKYWHVAHLPFALIMLVIMVIHVGITIAFGYKWIF